MLSAFDGYELAGLLWTSRGDKYYRVEGFVSSRPGCVCWGEWSIYPDARLIRIESGPHAGSLVARTIELANGLVICPSDNGAISELAIGRPRNLTSLAIVETVLSLERYANQTI